MKRIYIVADLVGASGVRLAEQCEPGGRGWEEPRAFLAGDVNAAVDGAFSAGAEEVTVCDVHGPAPDNLPMKLADARAIYEAPFEHMLLPGLTDGFSGLFVVGAHAMAGAPGAFMDQTMDPKLWFRYRLAGRECGEIGMWDAYAGHYHVPLLLVTGDAAACREAEEFTPGVEAVAVKEAVGRERARTRHPEACAKHIREAAVRALGQAEKVEPCLIDLPNEVEVEYVLTEYAAEAASRPGAELVEARTVRRELGSTLDIVKGF